MEPTIPYSATNFPQDFAMLREIDSPEWDPPWDDSPLVNLDGVIVRLPVRRFENRLHMYFCTKYGEGYGPDYCREFLTILEYIRENQIELTQAGMVRRVGDHLELTSQFTEVFRNSNNPPTWNTGLQLGST